MLIVIIKDQITFVAIENRVVTFDILPFVRADFFAPSPPLSFILIQSRLCPVPLHTPMIPCSLNDIPNTFVAGTIILFCADVFTRKGFERQHFAFGVRGRQQREPFRNLGVRAQAGGRRRRRRAPHHRNGRAVREKRRVRPRPGVHSF